jgi:hypothetical protein
MSEAHDPNVYWCGCPLCRLERAAPPRPALEGGGLNDVLLYLGISGATPEMCEKIVAAKATITTLSAQLADARKALAEDAARVVERYSLPTIQAPSMWLIDKAAIAREIRALAADKGNG